MTRRSSTATPCSCRRSGKRAGGPSFLLGTDAVGRDMLSRLIYGAQYSLFIGIVVVAIALIGGIFVGLLAGSLAAGSILSSCG
jgi:ABC-type dipeptide/oligopeptide/nickel transport system permease subunit